MVFYSPITHKAVRLPADSGTSGIWPALHLYLREQCSRALLCPALSSFHLYILCKKSMIQNSISFCANNAVTTIMLITLYKLTHSVALAEPHCNLVPHCHHSLYTEFPLKIERCWKMTSEKRKYVRMFLELTAKPGSYASCWQIDITLAI